MQLNEEQFIEDFLSLIEEMREKQNDNACLHMCNRRFTVLCNNSQICDLINCLNLCDVDTKIEEEVWKEREMVSDTIYIIPSL